MSRLVLKRFSRETVVVDRDTRLTVGAMRGDGPHADAVTIRLEHVLPDGSVSDVTFGLTRGGAAAPVGANTTVELQRAYGTRCWLMFEGPPDVPISRGEVMTHGPWAVAPVAAAIGGGR